MTRSAFEQTYPESAFGGFSRVDGTIQFYSRVQALLRAGGTVLDVGCGRGVYLEDKCEYRRRLRCLKGQGRKVMGIDVDPGAVQNPNIDDFREIQDPANWPVETASVEFIICDYVLEHVTNPAVFFREVQRVLTPGGVFCARTPNAYCYPALAARIVPNRWHSRIVKSAQDSRRKQEDVFPTVYRCNTKRKLERQMQRSGLAGVVYRTESEPSYLAFSQTAYRIGSIAHRLMLPVLQTSLLVFCQRAR